MFSKLPLRTVMVAALPLLAAACMDPAVAPSERASRLPLSRMSNAVSPSDRHLVQLRSGEAKDFQKAVEALGGKVARRQKGVPILEVSGLTDAAAAVLAKRKEIASIDRDMIVQWIPAAEAAPTLARALGTPSGPRATGTDQSGAAFFGFQWNMHIIGMDAVYGAGNGGSGRTVCVLDTGIDPDHLDFAGRTIRARSVITTPVFPGDLDPIDYNSHGTLSAGFIASNGIGVASVAPDVNLCTIKVLNVLGSGSFGDVITGIVEATDMRADVINMSLGAHVDLTIPGAEDLVRALQAAVNFANSRGVIVVASAGNNGIDLNEDPFITLPAEIKGVVAVGATAPFAQQNFDNIASYSNYGGKSVDLFAPGGDFLPGGNQFDLVLGPCSQYQLVLPFECAFNDYLIAAGTSEAAPHVSGAAAVVESGVAGQVKPAKLEACLESSADVVGPTRIFGAGRLNVLKALSCTL